MLKEIKARVETKQYRAMIKKINRNFFLFYFLANADTEDGLGEDI